MTKITIYIQTQIERKKKPFFFGLYLYPLLFHLSLKICHALAKGLSGKAE